MCSAYQARAQDQPQHWLLTNRHCLFIHCKARGLRTLRTTLPSKKSTLPGSPSSCPWHSCLGTSRWLQLVLIKQHVMSFLDPTTVCVQKTTTYSPVNNHVFSLGFLPQCSWVLLSQEQLALPAQQNCATMLSTHNAGCGNKNHLLQLKPTFRNLQGRRAEPNQELQRCSHWTRSRAFSLSISHSFKDSKPSWKTKAILCLF